MVTAGQGDVSMAVRESNDLRNSDVRPTATVRQARVINMMASSGGVRDLMMGRNRRAGNISMLPDTGVDSSKSAASENPWFKEENAQKTVLVVGATGYIGKSVTKEM